MPGWKWHAIGLVCTFGTFGAVILLLLRQWAAAGGAFALAVLVMAALERTGQDAAWYTELERRRG